MARPRGEAGKGGKGGERGERAEPRCVGDKCTITETEVFGLADFYTYERNFHLGPIFTKGISESGKAELKRQAKLKGGDADTCAKGCRCEKDTPQPIPPWGQPEKIDIFGFGDNGLVFYCTAKRHRRTFKGRCKAA